MWFKCLLVLAVAATAWGRSATSSVHNSIHHHAAEDAEAPRASETSWYFGDLRYAYKIYQECAAKDLAPCLKLKLLAAMDRAARNFVEVPIFEGVSFVKDPSKAAAAPAEKSEAELEAALPRSLNERDDALNNLIADKVSGFFDTHTLQVKLPSSSELSRSLEEGRGKKKKGSMLLIPLILAGTLVPLALGALALLAGKALIVSKLALVLASIIGLKKLLSGGGSSGHEANHEVVVSGGHSGWGRSYEKEAALQQQAQNLAYGAYAPKSR